MRSEKPSLSINDQTDNFYEFLPRFIAVSDSTVGNDVKPVEKDFEWRQLRFNFIITPAQITISDSSGDSGKDQYVFPGAQEEALEKTLRFLAVDENMNFKREQRLLGFSLSYITAAFAIVNKESLNEMQLKKSLEILSGSAYTLKRRHITYNFNLINSLKRLKIAGESCYLLELNSLFFNHLSLDLELFKKEEENLTF